jgi:hypothetical protein
MTSTMTEAAFVADEDLVGAEWVSVGAVGLRLDDPSGGAGSDEVALHLHQPTSGEDRLTLKGSGFEIRPWCRRFAPLARQLSIVGLTQLGPSPGSGDGPRVSRFQTGEPVGGISNPTS